MNIARGGAWGPSGLADGIDLSFCVFTFNTELKMNNVLNFNL